VRAARPTFKSAPKGEGGANRRDAPETRQRRRKRPPPPRTRPPEPGVAGPGAEDVGRAESPRDPAG